MSDTTVNRFVAQFADAAARTGFVPSPPTVASGPNAGYFAYQQDDGSFWTWDDALADWVNLLSGSGVAGIKVATVTITNAEMLALPTTPKTLVAAPGAGKAIIPIAATLFFKAGGVAYTNIAPDSNINLVVGAHETGTYMANDSTLGTPLTNVSSFLGTAGAFFRFTYPWQNDRGSAGDWGLIAYPEDIADFDNAVLALMSNNDGAGNYTGGNAGNVIVARVLYEEVTLP